jgi:hypothetical protein
MISTQDDQRGPLACYCSLRRVVRLLPGENQIGRQPGPQGKQFPAVPAVGHDIGQDFAVANNRAQIKGCRRGPQPAERSGNTNCAKMRSSCCSAKQRPQSRMLKDKEESNHGFCGGFGLLFKAPQRVILIVCAY